MTTRRDQARSYARGQLGRAARGSRLHLIHERWQQLPPRVRTFVPLVAFVALAVTYPWYVSSLPTNVPIILAFPGLHSAVTILVFVVMAVWPEHRRRFT